VTLVTKPLALVIFWTFFSQSTSAHRALGSWAIMCYTNLRFTNFTQILTQFDTACQTMVQDLFKTLVHWSPPHAVCPRQHCWRY